MADLTLTIDGRAGLALVAADADARLIAATGFSLAETRALLARSPIAGDVAAIALALVDAADTDVVVLAREIEAAGRVEVAARLAALLATLDPEPETQA